MTVVFRNASVLDPLEGALLEGHSVVVEGDRIVDVSSGGATSKADQILDLGGMTLMPGLIDCHVHVIAMTADVATLAHMSTAYVTARAGRLMRDMLFRGFTTVRDVGGADYGIAQAVEEGYLIGPRIVFGGKALSQTGGHGDSRSRGSDAVAACYCTASLCRVCDGAAEARRAARDEIRRGARHVKVMLGGGIASPTDRIDSVQFSAEELQAIVEEAESANLYVTGHAYTARAVKRGLECGVRCIEHGNLMDESSVQLMKERGAFYVPTLATYSALARRGLDLGLPKESHPKIFEVLDRGLGALELAHRAGVPIGYGTDLLGAMQEEQLNEFELRAQVQKPIDVIRSATSTAAQLLRLEGQVGVIAPGAFADLLVIDGAPLLDLSVMTQPERSLRLIMKGGQVFKNELQ